MARPPRQVPLHLTGREAAALETFLGAMTRDQLKKMGLGDVYLILADVHMKVTSALGKDGE